MNRFIVLLGALAVAMGCVTDPAFRPPDAASNQTALGAATSQSSPNAAPHPPLIDERRQRTVELAQNLLGETRLKVGRRTYRNDCTGLVRAVYDQLGIDVFQEAHHGDSGVQAIYRFVRLHGRVFETGAPLPGDLVFFRETYGDYSSRRLTHIGLVESVGDEGTVSVIHRVRRGVVRYHMNLNRRGIHTDPNTGQTLNDYLRFSKKGQKQVLTGELFVAFGSLLRPAITAER